jgi:hypothetical protein
MARYDVNFWQSELKLSEKELENFHTAGDSVNGHYLDNQEAATDTEGLGASKVNMFWANVGILKSALYGNPPKPIAAREFQDPEDDIARVAAAMIERLIRTGPNGSGMDMHEAFQHAVEDRLIPGMGQVWLRYDAKIVENEVEGQKVKKIVDENVPCDYVYWKDFFYSPARVWEEVTWVARRVWMDPESGKTRFPKVWARIPLVIPKDGKSYPASAVDSESNLRRGEIFEIWCKSTRKVYWVAHGCDEILDEQSDPLELKEFFPCPRPLAANTTTKKFIGRADYTMVQDQYAQLNSINVRLSLLIDACKAVGVYDKTAEGVQKMLSRAAENQLIPVDNWAMFAEKGGLKGVIDWLPIEAIVAVIEKLREARADIVQQIYELTGISDIMRGVTNARETYGAQQLKAQYSSSRLQLYQMQVGAFVAGAMDIKANIISKHFQPETIIRKSLVMFTPDREFAEAAVKLIKDSWELMYRINVSSTQMSIPDYNAEKQMRQEFVTSMGQFVGQVTPLLEKAPAAAPFMLKILQWAGASFSTSGGVETLFDNYIREVQKQLAAPPPPNPEVAKAQAEAQAAMQKTQAEGLNDQKIAQFDAQIKEGIAKIEANVRIQIANINAASAERIARMKLEEGARADATKAGEVFQGTAQEIADEQQALELAHKEAEIQSRAAEMAIQSLVDTAVQEIRNAVSQHENKVDVMIAKAKATEKQEEKKEKEKKDEKEKKEAKAETVDTAAVQKMHADLMESVSAVVDGLKGLTGKKSISITLPDGGKASAEVTPGKTE